MRAAAPGPQERRRHRPPAAGLTGHDRSRGCRAAPAILVRGRARHLRVPGSARRPGRASWRGDTSPLDAQAGARAGRIGRTRSRRARIAPPRPRPCPRGGEPRPRARRTRHRNLRLPARGVVRGDRGTAPGTRPRRGRRDALPSSSLRCARRVAPLLRCRGRPRAGVYLRVLHGRARGRVEGAGARAPQARLCGRMAGIQGAHRPRQSPATRAPALSRYCGSGGRGHAQDGRRAARPRWARGDGRRVPALPAESAAVPYRGLVRSRPGNDVAGAGARAC